MEQIAARKIKFKAWNSVAGLLMKLDSIECYKGELFKKDHVLLQFTGLYDKEGDEIYDQDIILQGYQKFVVFWNEAVNGWYYRALAEGTQGHPFVAGAPEIMKRFCSAFELQKFPG